MKERNTFLGRLFSKEHQKKVEVKVDIIEYEEDGIFYAFSPALDLVGYGASIQEARDSWENVLEEYIRYTLNKGTLYKDLQQRGWHLKGKRICSPPTFSWMLQNNDQLSEVYNKHDFKKVSRPVPLAYA